MLEPRPSTISASAVLLTIALLLSSPVLAAAKDGQDARQHVPLTTKAPQPKTIDWDKVTGEAIELLSKYFQINTTNPPGNEIPAAKMLKEKFLTDGIPANTWEPLPGRGIVAARLHGIGKHNKAILLLSHMDVVPADPKEWQVPPFSGQVKDGFIWGRGTIDDKGPGVVELMAMLAIKRSGILLDRDILFVATGDEEEGGKNGAQWFADHEHDVYGDAGYLLNEGGGIRAQPNQKKLYAVSVTEKTPMWLRLTANGPAGHAAAPAADTSVTRLVHALQSLIDFHQPIRIIAPVEDFYHAVGLLNHGPKQFYDLRAALRDPVYLRQFLSEPDQNAAVHNTVAPTVLWASQKTNIIPGTATAEVDCRLLPGTDPKNFINDIRKAVNDKNVKIDVILNFPSNSSPSRSFLMNAIQTLARRDDQTEAVPMMISGFTDSHYFREQNIVAYGFIPIQLSREDARGVHGVNERISIKELGAGIKRMVALLKILGGR
ncbi:MAG TPA: M20/M25/M40 family metallo-hydrolase [Candidatus Binataceae bacterium]